MRQDSYAEPQSRPTSASATRPSPEVYPRLCPQHEHLPSHAIFHSTVRPAAPMTHGSRSHCPRKTAITRHSPTHSDIIRDIYTGLWWRWTAGPVPKFTCSKGTDLMTPENVPHWICADVWIAARNTVDHDMLTGTIHHWLPILSDKLTFAVKTYLVLVHSVPTNFETSHDSLDVTALLADNEDVISHPSLLQHTEFITHTHNQSLFKAHHSLVMYLTDPLVTNNCTACQIAFCGHLLPTAKFSCLGNDMGLQNLCGSQVQVVTGWVWVWISLPVSSKMSQK